MRFAVNVRQEKALAGTRSQHGGEFELPVPRISVAAKHESIPFFGLPADSEQRCHRNHSPGNSPAPAPSEKKHVPPRSATLYCRARSLPGWVLALTNTNRLPETVRSY